MFNAVPHLHHIDEVDENDWQPVKSREKPAKASFRNAIKDFYLTNPIARASALMAELSAGAKARRAEDIAARMRPAARPYRPGAGRLPACAPADEPVSRARRCRSSRAISGSRRRCSTAIWCSSMSR